jgi:hypothetical protein
MSVFGGIGLAGVLAGMRPASEGGEAWFVFFGLCFLLTPLISLLAMPFKGMKRLKASRLMSQGIAATGTLLEVQDTGVTINANPRVRLRFRIEANGDYPMPPFEAEKTATIPRVMQPRVGDRFPVWVDQEDPSKWMFATTPEGAPSAQTPSLRRVIQLARHGAAPAVPAPPGDVVGELNKLNALRLAGKISSDEFAARTSDLIASG